MYLNAMGMRGILTVWTMWIAAAAAAQTPPYIATSSNYFCAGGTTPITLYGNVSVWDPGTDPGAWTYAWSPPELFADPSTQLVELLPEATLTLTLTMVSPAGQVFIDDIILTVYPEFTVNAGVDVEACSTDGVQLQATTTAASAVAWVWAPATGLSDPTVSDPVLVGDVNAVYTVTATVTGPGGAACPASDVVEVGVLFPAFDLGPDITACAGENVVITPGLPANCTLVWSVPGATTSATVTAGATVSLTAISPEGCVRSDSITVTFTDGPGAVLSGPAFFCAGDGASLTAAPQDASNPPFSVVWGHGPTGTAAAVTETGTYTATVRDASGCASTGEWSVTAWPSPEVSLVPDTVVCFEDFPDVPRYLLVDGGYAGYTWSTGSNGPLTQISGPGIYTVAVTNAIGCTTLASTQVEGFCATPLLFVPSAFTPDGDGNNEVLRIEGRNVVDLELILFDRWGNEVWRAAELGDYWHGQGPERTHYTEDGSYFWRARYRYLTDPYGGKSPWQERSGAVYVLR
jgi:hypothetical protein